MLYQSPTSKVRSRSLVPNLGCLAALFVFLGSGFTHAYKLVNNEKTVFGSAHCYQLEKNKQHCEIATASIHQETVVPLVLKDCSMKTNLAAGVFKKQGDYFVDSSEYAFCDATINVKVKLNSNNDVVEYVEEWDVRDKSGKCDPKFGKTLRLTSSNSSTKLDMQGCYSLTIW